MTPAANRDSNPSPDTRPEINIDKFGVSSSQKRAVLHFSGHASGLVTGERIAVLARFSAADLAAFARAHIFFGPSIEPVPSPLTNADSDGNWEVNWILPIVPREVSYSVAVVDPVSKSGGNHEVRPNCDYR